MTDENEQAGTPDDARYDRAAMDFMDATIALSDLGAKFAATPPPDETSPGATTGLNVGRGRGGESDQLGNRWLGAAEAVRARAAASAVDNAREAVEYGQQHGIPVPQHIIATCASGSG